MLTAGVAAKARARAAAAAAAVLRKPARRLHGVLDSTPLNPFSAAAAAAAAAAGGGDDELHLDFVPRRTLLSEGDARSQPLPHEDEARVIARLGGILRGHEEEETEQQQRRRLGGLTDDVRPEAARRLLQQVSAAAPKPAADASPKPAAATAEPAAKPTSKPAADPVVGVVSTERGVVKAVNHVGVLNARGQPQGQLLQDLTFLRNDRLTVGIDVPRGGAVGQISSDLMPAPFTGKNLVNVWDCGRLLQQSYYGCDDGSCWASKKWRWNPGEGFGLVVEGGGWFERRG